MSESEVSEKELKDANFEQTRLAKKQRFNLSSRRASSGLVRWLRTHLTAERVHRPTMAASRALHRARAANS